MCELEPSLKLNIGSGFTLTGGLFWAITVVETAIGN